MPWRPWRRSHKSEKKKKTVPRNSFRGTVFRLRENQRSWAADALPAFRSALVRKKLSSWGTISVAIRMEVKPPLYRQKPPWRAGDGGHQAVVGDARHHAEGPAVDPGDGSQAAGVAQPHGGALGAEGVGPEEGGHGVANHDGPHVQRVAAGGAETDHAEGDAQGHAGAGGVGHDIVGGDEQPIDPDVQNGAADAVAVHKVGLVAGIPQQRSVSPEGAAVEQEARQDAQNKYRNAESADKYRRPLVEDRADFRGGVPQGFIQQRVEEEPQQTRRQGGGVEVEPLVYRRGVCGQGRRQYAHRNAHHQCQRNTRQGKAVDRVPR